MQGETFKSNQYYNYRTLTPNDPQDLLKFWLVYGDVYL